MNTKRRLIIFSLIIIVAACLQAGHTPIIETQVGQGVFERLCSNVSTFSGMTLRAKTVDVEGSVHSCPEKSVDDRWVQPQDEKKFYYEVDFMCRASYSDRGVTGKASVLQGGGMTIPCSFVTSLTEDERITTEGEVKTVLTKADWPRFDCAYTYINPSSRAGFIGYTRDAQTWYPNGTTAIYKDKNTLSIDGVDMRVFNAKPYGYPICN
jgi:hypothetical protein